MCGALPAHDGVCARTGVRARPQGEPRAATSCGHVARATGDRLSVRRPVRVRAAQAGRLVAPAGTSDGARVTKLAQATHAIPVARPVIGEAELAAVRRPLLSGWLTQGPEVAGLEREFAAFVGAEHACAVSNCTTALHLALL